MFHGCQLSPEGDGIGDNKVGLYFSDFLCCHIIQGKGRRNKEFRCKCLVFSYPVCVPLVLHFKIVSVTADQDSSGLFNLFPKHLKRKIVDLMPRSRQFSHNSERWVGMTVGRNTKPGNFHVFHHQSTSTFLATRRNMSAR